MDRSWSEGTSHSSILSLSLSLRNLWQKYRDSIPRVKSGLLLNQPTAMTPWNVHKNLKDSLRQLKKGTLSVSEFAKQFKAICDQLSAIGQTVSNDDKSHWFLCGLGPTFGNFSTAYRALPTHPMFRDFVAQAEGHELFISSLHEPTPPLVAFTVNISRGRGIFGQSNHHGNSFSHGRGQTGRWPPHSQLCCHDGHYASVYPDLSSYAQRSSHSATNLAQAFNVDCNINESTPDWYIDFSATARMALSSIGLDSSATYHDKDKVVFGNGKMLPISRTSTLFITPHLKLIDVSSFHI